MMRIRYYKPESVRSKILQILESASEGEVLDRRVPIMDIVDDDGNVMYTVSIVLRGDSSRPFLGLAVQGLSRDVVVRPEDFAELMDVMCLLKNSEKARGRILEFSDWLIELRQRFRKRRKIDTDREGLEEESEETGEIEEKPHEKKTVRKQSGKSRQ